MTDGEDDERGGRKWIRPGIKSSGVAVEWVESMCHMSWLKSCPVYSHPIQRKQERQPPGLPTFTLSHHMPFHSPKKNL